MPSYKISTMGEFVDILPKVIAIREASFWTEAIKKSLCPWGSFAKRQITPESIKEVCSAFSAHIADRLKLLQKMSIECRHDFTYLYEHSHAFLKEVWEITKEMGFQIRLEEIDRINANAF